MIIIIRLAIFDPASEVHAMIKVVMLTYRSISIHSRDDIY